MLDVRQFSSDKILDHIDRIHEWISAGSSHPITYEIDMTNICNNNCPFCFGFYKREENPSSITKDKAIDIIKQIIEFGGRAITFTGGGEPLCNPATMELIEFAGKSGIDVGFITNGLLLNREKAETIIKYCKWVRISLDAGSHKVYEKTHGLDGNTYEKILKNTEILIEEKTKSGSNITIGFGYLTPPVMKEDMRDFVLLSKKIGVDYAQFRPVLRRFGEKRINFDTKDTINYIKELYDEYSGEKTKVLFSRHKYETLIDGHMVRPYEKCYGHNFATVVGADGKMYLCCHTRGLNKYCLGDLNEDTLENIWQSKRRAKVVSNIDFSDCPYLCRCDSFNTILWNIKREKIHNNFL